MANNRGTKRLPITNFGRIRIYTELFRAQAFEGTIADRQIGKRHLCNNDRSEKPAFLEIGPNGSGTTAYLDTFYAGRTKCAERRRGLEKERGIPSGSGPEAQLSSVAARTAARFLADAGSPGQFAW